MNVSSLINSQLAVAVAGSGQLRRGAGASAAIGEKNAPLSSWFVNVPYRTVTPHGELGNWFLADFAEFLLG